jgi:4-hydroxy-tetrahydrodipicolinate reductase
MNLLGKKQIAPKTVVLVGLGATGIAMAQSILRRTDLSIIGATDRNEAIVGADLGSLVGVASTGAVVGNDMAELPEADPAIVATTSDLSGVASTLMPLLERSYNVLSICEELSHPWDTHPGSAKVLGETAKAHGVTVLGSGPIQVSSWTLFRFSSLRSSRVSIG